MNENTQRYYRALYQFNEGAEQMRAALEVLHDFEVVRQQTHYATDLEILRSSVSERAAHCVSTLEQDNGLSANRGDTEDSGRDLSPDATVRQPDEQQIANTFVIDEDDPDHDDADEEDPDDDTQIGKSIRRIHIDEPYPESHKLTLTLEFQDDTELSIDLDIGPHLTLAVKTIDRSQRGKLQISHVATFSLQETLSNAQQQQLLWFLYDLAVASAQEEIENHCVPNPIDGLRWHDAHEEQRIADALHFLEQRGCLDRHPADPHIVRVVRRQASSSRSR